MHAKGITIPHVLPAGTSIEVRCHLNCPWSPGFEIEEPLLLDDEVSYRIRRAESGRPLPTAFGAEYVRRLERGSLTCSVSGQGRRRGRRELERPST